MIVSSNKMESYNYFKLHSIEHFLSNNFDIKLDNSLRGYTFLIAYITEVISKIAPN